MRAALREERRQQQQEHAAAPPAEGPTDRVTKRPAWGPMHLLQKEENMTYFLQRHLTSDESLRSQNIEIKVT